MDKLLVQNRLKGLLPYEKGEEPYFSDRKLLNGFFYQLQRDKFVAVSGDEGSGKTSFLNTAVVNLISSIDSTKDWDIVFVRPGINPIKNLIYHISKSKFQKLTKFSNNLENETEEIFTGTSNGLVEFFKKFPLADRQNLLIIIDPLDDLITLEKHVQRVGDLSAEKHINAFINLLYTFQQLNFFPVYIVLSLSGNTIGRIAKYPKLMDLVQKFSFSYEGARNYKMEEVIENILPEEFRFISDYKLFRDLLVNDLKKVKENSLWLYFLQHSLKMTFDIWSERKDDLQTSYQKTGRAGNSINVQASQIYNSFGNVHKRKCELVFRAMFISLGVSAPIKFNTLKSLVCFKIEDVPVIREIIELYGEKGLGIIEIIPGSNIAERLGGLNSENYIGEEAVLKIRNDLLSIDWQLLNDWIDDEMKLILEYEWISRLAYNQSKFPLSLRQYALMKLKNDNLNLQEFKVINELLLVSKEWAMFNIGKTNGYADFEITINYLKQGIDFWTKRAIDKENRLKAASRLSKIKIILIFVFSLIFFLPYNAYKHIEVSKKDMHDEIDCLSHEYSRIQSFIDSLYISQSIRQLYEGEVEKNTPHFINNTINHKKWVLMLKSGAFDIDRIDTALYKLTMFDFVFQFRAWEKRVDEEIEKGKQLHDQVLQQVLNSNFLDKGIGEIRTYSNPLVCPNNGDINYGALKNLYVIDCKSCR